MFRLLHGSLSRPSCVLLLQASLFVQTQLICEPVEWIPEVMSPRLVLFHT